MKDFDLKLNAFFTKFEENVKHEFPDMVARTAVSFFRGEMRSKSWDGVPWQPYGNKKREPKRGGLLMRDNNLFNSIKASHISPSKVTISAGNNINVKYARIHNEGGLVAGTRKIRGYNNNNFMGKGKPVRIKAHSRTVNYTMPKRQFMGKSNLLLEEIKTRFKNNFKTI